MPVAWHMTLISNSAVFTFSVIIDLEFQESTFTDIFVKCNFTDFKSECEFSHLTARF